nr:L-lactate permease [Veillonella ratti]
MSSNILFGNLQMLAAKALGINPAITAALQTTGGVLGNSFSPGCVIMGIVTTEFNEGEDKILKLMMPFTIALAVIFGLLGFMQLLL